MPPLSVFWIGFFIPRVKEFSILTVWLNVQEELRKERISPKERLGQNFLTDRALAQRIVDSSSITEEDQVIEIGPGLGALTGFLSQRASHLYVLEKDERFLPLLKKTFAMRNNITYYQGDALTFDFSLLPVGTIMVGNLPYYLSSPFLRCVLPLRDHLSSMTFMLQREVARRMVASPGGKEYGILSLAVQYYARPFILEEVPPHVFYPMPDVYSALIKLLPLSSPPVEVVDEDFFFKVIRAGFQQRRKMLKNTLSHNLKINKDELERMMKELDIQPNIRGERLSLSQFASLSNSLLKMRKKNRERR